MSSFLAMGKGVVVPPLVAPERAVMLPSGDHGSRLLSVLVVDDFLDTAESLAIFFNLSGYDVRAVDSGPAALQAIQEQWPDAVLLDIAMPRMTGYEVAKRIRELSVGRPKLFLIAISGNATPTDKQLALSEGMDAFFAKPANPEELAEWLTKAVAER